MNLIAIDPGKTTGWAAFNEEGTLVGAGVAKKSEIWKWGHEKPFGPLPSVLYGTGYAYTVLVEHPRWYPHDHTDVNDLIDLAVLVGELRHAYSDRGSLVELVWPRTWKGNVEKKITTERILKRLSPAELAVVPRRPRAKDVDHNCADAVGLGLWKLGRLR